jgi:hypothetical protein
VSVYVQEIDRVTECVRVCDRESLQVCICKEDGKRTIRTKVLFILIVAIVKCSSDSKKCKSQDGEREG